MAGTSPGFPGLRALSSGSDLPAEALEPSFDTMPTLSPPKGAERGSSPLPSLTAQSDARLQAALAASARAEASLNGLFRAIQHLGTGVGGAREANELLAQELEVLRDMLGAANDQQVTLKQKVSLLEQALDRSRKDAQRDREFLLEQHDAFIVILMDEQESELARRDRDLNTLRGRLAELERRGSDETLPPPSADTPGSASMKPTSGDDEGLALDRAERAELERTAQKLAEDRERARETVRRLQTQRDEAQGAVARISQERDEALHQIHRLKSELGGPRIPLSTRPPPPPPSSPKVAVPGLGLPPQSSTAATVKPSAHGPVAPPVITSIVTPPPSNPLSAPRPARMSPPPDELRRALVDSPTLQPLTSSSRPPLKQKPDVSTRPLVGYSLNDDSVQTEQLEGVRLSKPPPTRDKR